MRRHVLHAGLRLGTSEWIVANRSCLWHTFVVVLPWIAIVLRLFDSLNSQPVSIGRPHLLWRMRVVVTGLGVVSPLGVGIQHAWTNLLKKGCGIVDLGEDFAKIPSTVGGKVPLGSAEEGKWNPTEWVESVRRTPLFAQYALAASKMALDDAKWHPTEEQDLKDSGVCVGSGIGGFDAAYDNSVAFSNGGYRKVSPLFVPSLLANMAAGHVSIASGFRGPNHCVSTACTAGAHSIGDAANFIRAGMAKVMLAGSTEAAIHPAAVAGFARARSLATKYNDEPEKASRPFDGKRDGFVIGEGASMLVLEEYEHAVSRGAKIYAELAGYGASGDAHHITAPHPDGRGAQDCMEMALRSSGLDASDVQYVNAHATSTQLGDAIESKAIVNVFGKDISVSSTKGATGHLLGAAGALEAAFTIKAVQEQILPPNLNLTEIGPEFEANYVTEATPAKVKAAITNSFGFGGTNASLLFKYVESA